MKNTTSFITINLLSHRQGRWRRQSCQTPLSRYPLECGSCRNTSSVTVSGSRFALFAVTTCPATENSRSTEALVAGMASKFEPARPRGWRRQTPPVARGPQPRVLWLHGWRPCPRHAHRRLLPCSRPGAILLCYSSCSRLLTEEEKKKNNKSTNLRYRFLISALRFAGRTEYRWWT